MPDPLSDVPRLKMVQRAIMIGAAPPKRKLPVTQDVLAALRPFLDAESHDGRTLWAAFTLAHYGCLRGAEVCPASVFDPTIHLRCSDVTFDHRGVDSRVSVTIRASKTDIANAGFTVHSACTATNICACCALHQLMSRRLQWTPDEPLFQYATGAPLTRSALTSSLQTLLPLAGLEPSLYSGHSFRAGGATSAAAAGMADWELKLLGRWNSDCYQRYIRATPQQIARMSRRMTRPTALAAVYNKDHPFTKNCFN
jgi:hypothetical protein